MRVHHSAKQWAFLSLLALAVSTGTVSTAGAQRAQVGIRAGGNFTTNDPLIGGHLVAPLGTQIDLYPSVDIYLPDRGSRESYSADLKANLPISPSSVLYLGGGLNILHRSVARTSRTDFGPDLFLGYEYRAGVVHPFVEERILFHDTRSFQLSGGLNFTLGGR